MAAEAHAQFRSTQHVHYDMLDFTGALHNLQYMLLMERARTDFWRSHGMWPGAKGFEDWPYVTARHEVDFVAIVPGEIDVEICCEIVELGKSSVTFSHKMLLPDGKSAATARTVLVRVDAKSGEPVPWSDRVVRLFKKYMPVADDAGDRANEQ